MPWVYPKMGCEGFVSGVVTKRRQVRNTPLPSQCRAGTSSLLEWMETAKGRHSGGECALLAPTLRLKKEEPCFTLTLCGAFGSA